VSVDSTGCELFLRSPKNTANLASNPNPKKAKNAIAAIVKKPNTKAFLRLLFSSTLLFRE
jgi:hypothetical protein